MTEPVERVAAVQSVDRAVRILEIVARKGQVGLGQVARELGVHRSTASRLVASLAAHELLERLDGNGGVRLGVGLLRLAGSTASQLDLATQADPVCQALATELDETANVAVISGGVAINVSQGQGSSTVAMQNWVGQHTVLHATSSGKVLLAYLDEAEREEFLEAPLERFTDKTVTSPSDLRAELDRVRQAGWAHVLEEFEEGLNAVAAPIRAHDGSVVAAISVAGPAYRLSPERLPDVAGAVMRAAATISRRMGYRMRT